MDLAKCGQCGAIWDDRIQSLVCPHRVKPVIRPSRMTNEQLDQIAKSHRHNASDESAMTFPENSEHYRESQAALAEVFEELLDRRAASGEPRA